METGVQQVIEDSKVVSAGVCTLWLQYSQVLSETLTLFISVCTAIYVGRRAVKAILDTIKDFKAFIKKRKGK